MNLRRTVLTLLALAVLVSVAELVMLLTGYIPPSGFDGAPTQHFVAFAVIHGFGCGCVIAGALVAIFSEKYR